MLLKLGHFSVPQEGIRLGTSSDEVAASRRRVPWWAARTAKTVAGALTATGAALSGSASVQTIADVMNDVSQLGWFSSGVRLAGVSVALVGAVWLLFANHREKDEIEVLRRKLTEAESHGLGHAAAQFRLPVRSINSFNQSGWTPENVQRFQQDALQFGKSLFDYLGVTEARVCLYEPGAVDTEPEDSTAINITALTWVWSTPVPGRHDPRDTIIRSKETTHMFQALKSRQPEHIKKRKRSKSAGTQSKKWKSSICMGVKAGNESVALLTVDSTAEHAFNNVAEGVLTLLGDLLSFAELEKDRARVVRLAQQSPRTRTLESTNRR